MDKIDMEQIGLTVDAVIKRGDMVVLIKRKYDPFKGCWAIPGGFVEYGETVDDAVVRGGLFRSGKGSERACGFCLFSVQGGWWGTNS